MNLKSSLLPDGIILINKHEGLSSHSIVKKLRGIYRGNKFGHLGTLDPMATGLLPILVNRANRLHFYLNNRDKKYKAEIFLGQNTDTYDRTGSPTSEIRSKKLNEIEIVQVLEKFKGKIVQYPPAFSAIKVDGKPLYKYARQGKIPEIKPREVEIFSIDLISIKDNFINLKIHCSSGTYIRSLAFDIGKELGIGGHLYNLVRTEVGWFDNQNATSINSINENSDAIPGDKSFVPMVNLLPEFKTVEIIDPDILTLFFNGNEIDIESVIEKPYNSSNKTSTASDLYIRVQYNYHLIGIAILEDNRLKPKTVFKIEIA